MAPKKSDDLADALRKFALGYPEAVESIACKGTTLESRAFEARKKRFLFVATEHARLKLGPSQAAAKKLAAEAPGTYQIGSLGWVKVRITDDPPLELLERWIDESYRAVVDERLVAELEAPVLKPTKPKRRA